MDGSPDQRTDDARLTTRTTDNMAKKKPSDVLDRPTSADPIEESIDPAAPQDAGDTTAANVDRERVASRAYELYIARGGQHGRALDDWLEAEQELLESTRRTRDRE
jgi:hypothetical protein